jgi:MoaE-MoaD fusion protein
VQNIVAILLVKYEQQQPTVRGDTLQFHCARQKLPAGLVDRISPEHPMQYYSCMKVRVVYFGALKDLAGRGNETVELADGETTADLFSRLQQRISGLDRYAKSAAISVNYEYAPGDRPLRDGDEVGILPPVSGGSEPAPTAAAQPEKRTAIVSGAIQTRDIVEAIKHASDGAVTVFEGIVRDNSRGRRTLYLDYEAYQPMAQNQLEALVGEALTKFPIRDARIVHRIGRMEIGETSVLIVVASAHRGAAFDACRWLIDTLKKTVPIWKKEYFEDGAVWADGEPFPQSVVPGR